MFFDIRLDHRSYLLCFLLRRSKAILGNLWREKGLAIDQGGFVVFGTRDESLPELDAEELATSETLAYRSYPRKRPSSYTWSGRDYTRVYYMLGYALAPKCCMR